MLQISILNLLKISKINFRLAIQNNFFLAVIYLMIVPLMRGISNLDAVHSAECLRQSVILIGVIIIVPLNAPEHSESIHEIVYTKKIPHLLILVLRLMMAILTLIVLTAVFEGVMLLNNCEFPYIQYEVRSVINELALGSVGLLVSELSKSIVAGYLVSIGAFVFAYFNHI